MHANTISLVKSLSVGTCSCYEINGSCGMGYDPTTGKSTYTSKSGTKIKCMRCKARDALDADGVEYEKDDRVFYTVHN
jgi:hypothetical protein